MCPQYLLGLGNPDAQQGLNPIEPQADINIGRRLRPRVIVAPQDLPIERAAHDWQNNPMTIGGLPKWNSEKRIILEVDWGREEV